MKRLYDITYTVAMSDKHYTRLCEAADDSEELDQNLPLWNAGLDIMEYLYDAYGVRAHLRYWRLKRNAGDLGGRGK